MHRIMLLFELEGTPAQGVPSAAIFTFRNISFAIMDDSELTISTLLLNLARVIHF